MSNIVDNLQTKDGLTYSDVWTKLLDLSSSSDGSALVATNNKKKKDKKKPQTKKKDASSSCKDGCTFCKKWGKTGWETHHYKVCTYLNELKNNNSKPLPSASSSGKAQLAIDHAIDNGSNSHGVALIANDTTPSTSDISTFCQSLALKSQGLTLKGAHTREVWYFDTCASHHITADFSHLQEPSLAHTEIEVGGERVLIGTHVGTVRLSVQVAGEVVDHSLLRVVFIPGWGDTGNLIS